MSRTLQTLLLLLSLPLAAQSPMKEAQLEALNRQMWIPFIEGIRTDRAELYVGVHADDFHWVAPGSKGRIMDLAEYDDDSRTVMKRRKEAGERTEIDFRFLERNVDGYFAAEKVIVRYVLHRPDQPGQPSYGIAHYFSRKENGVWKMVLQYGSREQGTEALFATAAALDDVARFR